MTANPDGRLREARVLNNVTERTVILGGVRGARTVEVPPYAGIDTESGFWG